MISKLRFLAVYTITAIAFSFVVTSCVDEEEAGPPINEQRSLAAFDQIEVSGDIHVITGADITSSARINAPINRMSYIETSVVNGKLFIRERWNNVNKSDIVTVELAENTVSGIELYGSGKVEGAMITNDAIDLLVSGSGKIEFRVETNNLNSRVKGSGKVKVYGTSQYHHAEVDGSGTISSRYLIAESAEAEVNGSGFIELHAEEALTALVNGSGNISYWGKPAQIDARVNGSGRIRPME